MEEKVQGNFTATTTRTVLFFSHKRKFERQIGGFSSLGKAMSAIGSLVFCTDCGSLLDRATGPDQKYIKCTICGAVCKDTSEKTIVTRSKPSAFPSSLRAKRSEVQTVPEGETGGHARVNETCPKCGREEVGFYEMQTRSADEGSTIFYVCDCGHKWNQNN